MKRAPANVPYPDKFALRKVEDISIPNIAGILNGIANVPGAPGGLAVTSTSPDSLESWINSYLQLAVEGIRSETVAQKIALHLRRFLSFFVEAYGHDRISTCLRRDVVAWQRSLVKNGLAHSTVNNHVASLSAFTTWVHAQAPHLFAAGDPAKGVGELGLPPLEPKALTAEQVRSLKSVCDRLERFHELKGRHLGRHRTQATNRQKGTGSDPTSFSTSSASVPTPAHPTKSVDDPTYISVVSTHAHGRPWRDRAIVFVLLSTGLRREELVKLDIDQLEPNTPQALRNARRARLTRVKGKGKTERTVFLSADARTALADYLQRKRHLDALPPCSLPSPLFLSAASIAARAADGRLSPQAINLNLGQIGKWHDADIRDPTRHISPLRPHDLRHTFAFHLALATGADAYELERRLGHRSQRYI